MDDRSEHEEFKKSCRLNRRWQLWVKTKTCALCGEVIEAYKDSSVDHIVPLSKGGKDNWSNIQITHRHCNQLKDNLNPLTFRFLNFLNKYLFKIKPRKINK
ncbi:HNH endonuclease signature motif containing protein [Halobacteriovorax sp. GB3]|uniref:HNH endonuclease n=1 Tax=Halobacteriovorax sp. GB3 TaxID=2719615 RepID=UPI002A5034EC|nr:HNH endonuclease signature motif containing protein [Halobacteriovorax sp. GB3]